MKMSVVAGHCKLTMPIERIIKADPLTREVAKELKVDHSIIIQHLRQTGKLKKFDKGVPHELAANQKNNHLGVLCFILHNKTSHFSI